MARLRIKAIEFLKAKFGGYFWKSCPRCQRMFGGQESKHGGVLTIERFQNGSTGMVTCPRCPDEYEYDDGEIVTVARRVRRDGRIEVIPV